MMQRMCVMLVSLFMVGAIGCGQDDDNTGNKVAHQNLDPATISYMNTPPDEKKIDVDTLPKTLQDFHGIEYVLIRPGSFQMGSETGDSDEKPVHTVQITEPFYIGKYEVTQKQWRTIMGKNPSAFKGDDLPVESVSWNDAQMFIQRLNKFEKGIVYRLPTEAEWEYVCLAGTEDGNIGNLNRIAWHEGNSGKKSHPVGRKPANAWGVHDMLGNVWEWCQNPYFPYKGSDMAVESAFRVIDGGHATNNIVKDDKLVYRVFRGGSWVVPPNLIRPQNREKRNAEYLFNNVGLRLVRNIK